MGLIRGMFIAEPGAPSITSTETAHLIKGNWSDSTPASDFVYGQLAHITAVRFRMQGPEPTDYDGFIYFRLSTTTDPSSLHTMKAAAISDDFSCATYTFDPPLPIVIDSRSLWTSAAGQETNSNLYISVMNEGTASYDINRIEVFWEQSKP